MIVDLIAFLVILVVSIVGAFGHGISWGFVVVFAFLFIAFFVLYALLHEFEEVREKLKWGGLALAITALIPLLAVIACHQVIRKEN